MKSAQALKTKAEVEAFFSDWQAKKKGKAGFRDLENCIKQLSEQDGEELLEHVTEVKKTEEEFNTHWTKNATHFLGSSLYTALRKFLGLGEWWRFLFFWTVWSWRVEILCAFCFCFKQQH